MVNQDKKYANKHMIMISMKRKLGNKKKKTKRRTRSQNQCVLQECAAELFRSVPRSVKKRKNLEMQKCILASTAVVVET